MTRRQRRWFGFAASALVLALVVIKLTGSPEWHRFNGKLFWSTLAQARPGFLLAALAATYCTYLVRAWRWKIFLDPIKKSLLGSVFAGQVLGFSSIYLIGRLGEVVRPAYIARKVGVSFTSQLAITLLERIYDTIFLVLVFVVAVRIVPMNNAGPFGVKVVTWMHRGGQWMGLFLGLMVAALIAFRLRAGTLTGLAVKAASSFPERARNSIQHFLLSFSDGLGVIRNWRDFLSSIALTGVLWGLNGCVFWLVLQSLGDGLARLSLPAVGLVLFGAGLGLVVNFPGIGGGFQVGAYMVLWGLFGAGVEAAAGAANLIWIMISGPCLLLGLILLVHEGLTLRKLQAMAEEEGAVAAKKA